jgi:hypothetical protein
MEGRTIQRLPLGLSLFDALHRYIDVAIPISITFIVHGQSLLTTNTKSS